MEKDKKEASVHNPWKQRDHSLDDLMTDVSMNLWKKINAAYVIPRQKVEGVTHSTYKYNPELIERLDKEFNRKRDSFTEYVDAVARYKTLASNKKPLPKKERGEHSASKAVESSAASEAGNSAPAAPSP